MSLYRLNYEKKDLSDGYLERANKQNIDYEKDFENWLENSPHVLFEDNENTTIMWIGRQVTAVFDDRYKFPDLMGIDADGNVIIVELKKGKTPRDVVAQILEYAAWAEKLSYEQLNNITMKYYDRKQEFIGLELSQIHREIFYPDNTQDMEIEFNRKLRLFIVAEEIIGTVKDTVAYLGKYGIDINCLKYDVFSAENGNYYISTEIEEYCTRSVNANINSKTERWNGNEPIRVVVRKIVDNILLNKVDGIFTMKEVIDEALKEYPDFNKSSIRCLLYSDCVNHSSRKHYKSRQMDYYYQIEKTNYRLYNKEVDGIWNSDGEKVGE